MNSVDNLLGALFDTGHADGHVEQPTCAGRCGPTQQVSHGMPWSQRAHRVLTQPRPPPYRRSTRHRCLESGLLGGLADPAGHDIYLNVADPFCLVALGVQGSGKSHTAAVVLEDCVVPCPAPSGGPLVQLLQPMAALVLHYDPSEAAPCEVSARSSQGPMPIIAPMCCVPIQDRPRPFLPVT